MTAVLDIVLVVVPVAPVASGIILAVAVAVTLAPTGRRGAASLDFCAGLRRTGANAKLADQHVVSGGMYY